MNNKLFQNRSTTFKLVLSALLFAFALVLALVENYLPPVPVPVPGIRLGLSNIVVMFALFFVGKSQAFTIAVLKSLFVLSTKGVIAGLLSFCGGILSIAVMSLVIFIFKDKVSYLIVSILGSVFHNIGQFIAITIVYQTVALWAYLPMLIIFGIIAGVITSTLLRFILPAVKKVGLK